MALIPNISAGQGQKIGIIDLSDSYLHSAEFLRAGAYDGIVKCNSGVIGSPTPEYYQDFLITAFYLYRHAIELKLKKLARVLRVNIENIISKDRHNIEILWQKILSDTDNPDILLAGSDINCVVDVLRRYNVLENEQLFRYEAHNDPRIKAMSDHDSIPQEDFEVLNYGCRQIDTIILQLYEQMRIIK